MSKKYKIKVMPEVGKFYNSIDGEYIVVVKPVCVNQYHIMKGKGDSYQFYGKQFAKIEDLVLYYPHLFPNNVEEVESYTIVRPSCEEYAWYDVYHDGCPVASFQYEVDAQRYINSKNHG